MTAGSIETLTPRQMLDRMFRAEMSFMASEDGDVATLAEAFHPDVVIHEPTSLPYSGDWNGLHGVAGLTKAMSRVFSDMAVEDLQCSGSPERLHVLCKLRMTSRATGVSITQPFAEVLCFKDGRLIEGTPFYFDTAEILAALGNPRSAEEDEIPRAEASIARS